MGSISSPHSEYDVVIVGAGLSGINAAYRIQTELPDYSYTIIESRSAIGGTWDLFRYPGIRSDSDLHTFGFPWRPWTAEQTIADGESIKTYIRESAEEFGIDRNIQFHHKLHGANWSSEEQRWTLSVNRDSKNESKSAEKKLSTFKAKFIVLSTGYYDYSEALKADIPNLDTFKGHTIHPQFWPADLDYTGKKIVIIGSGATAVTIFPVLAEKAASVTMLQRSPTYIVSLPSKDPMAEFMKRFLPIWIAARITRWKFLFLPFLFFQFCQTFPNAARRAVRGYIKKSLPENVPIDPHFNPRYNPWEQRLCICPDGDFYTALKNGNADIVTDTIKTITETGIITDSGKNLDADIIVTATGLKLILAGGADLVVDGKQVNACEKVVWKSTMLQDLPNAAFVIGYTNASWTLGSDTAARLICRILKYLRSNGLTSAIPSLGPNTTHVNGNGHITGGLGENTKLMGQVRTDSKWNGMKKRKLLELNSTYLEKAVGILPMAGDRGPWLPRTNYFRDSWRAVWGDLTEGMRFEGPGGEGKKVV